MFRRISAFAFLLISTPAIFAQDLVSGALHENASAERAQIPSAWIDLRQSAAVNTKPQSTPDWVEAVTLGVNPAKPGVAASTVFRLRLNRPRPELQMLMFRLFFDDKTDQSPHLIVWDESGTQVLQSGALGNGLNLPSSETVMVPLTSASTIDIEVPGDGTNVRGAYLDWLTNSQVLHPANAEQRDLIPEPFSAAAPLHPPVNDEAKFGSVTASLSPDTIRIGPSFQSGASFQFGLEAQPLTALLTFEVAAAKIDSPPEVYLNGDNIGPVTLTLPELSDPGYRGAMTPLVRQMNFIYTGWIRAQKLVPAALLRNGTNDLVVVDGPGTTVGAIRSTQIELKYLWDNSDYLLLPDTK